MELSFGQGQGLGGVSAGKGIAIGRARLIVRGFDEVPQHDLADGDIAAVLALKETFTGDTLCDLDKPIVLEKISFPEPVIEVAIEPNSKGDQDKMGIALRRLAEEAPTFNVEVDEKLGQTGPEWAPR